MLEIMPRRSRCLPRAIPGALAGRHACAARGVAIGRGAGGLICPRGIPVAGCMSTDPMREAPRSARETSRSDTMGRGMGETQERILGVAYTVNAHTGGGTASVKVGEPTAHWT